MWCVHVYESTLESLALIYVPSGGGYWKEKLKRKVRKFVKEGKYKQILVQGLQKQRIIRIFVFYKSESNYHSPLLIFWQPSAFPFL